MKKVLFLVLCAFIMNACDEITKHLDGGVTEAETVAALKSALNIGAENAVGVLGIENGFFMNQALKILLPEEISQTLSLVESVPLLGDGITKLANDVVLALNRSAEDAVQTATPIFATAITSMTISDGVNILFGEDNAATSYLHEKTYTQLTDAFSPKVNASLSKELVANMSTIEIWTKFTTQYNLVANSAAGKLLDISPVNVNLGEYVTTKALDGLFVKVAEEESAIRTDPAARVTDLLKRVFGQLDGQ